VRPERLQARRSTSICPNPARLVARGIAQPCQRRQDLPLHPDSGLQRGTAWKSRSLMLMVARSCLAEASQAETGRERRPGPALRAPNKTLAPRSRPTGYSRSIPPTTPPLGRGAFPP